ncbi:tpt1 family protein [Cyclospora cayetanensis]|uniref:2'-phosphotransferase n=1 Tax=Cyclospora cayetanensis TaxID=88456 RepID=A0A1D3D6B1_9EIME|nr:tpt1 family protein [Cyclospora cayetanensis]
MNRCLERPTVCVFCGDSAAHTTQAAFEELGTAAPSLSVSHGRTHPASSQNPFTKFSRRLTKLLRHEGPRMGLFVRPDGFVSVVAVLLLAENHQFSISDVFSIVSTDAKQRFQLGIAEVPPSTSLPSAVGLQKSMRILPAGGVCCMQCTGGAATVYIRATQGHSIPNVQSDLLCCCINSSEELEDALLNGPAGALRERAQARGVTLVHGTYLRLWESIKNEGLKRMGRRHVHFTPFYGAWTGSLSDISLTSRNKVEDTEENKSLGCFSGFRASCNLLLILDFEKALGMGLKFFVAANGVVLTEGTEEGIVPFCCIRTSVDRRTGESLS